MLIPCDKQFEDLDKTISELRKAIKTQTQNQRDMVTQIKNLCKGVETQIEMQIKTQREILKSLEKSYDPYGNEAICK
jgi:Mg2+ and Co2+ transporter CorA